MWCKALRIMDDYRQEDLPCEMMDDGSSAVMLMDVDDSDGRTYRLEIWSTPDASAATAYVVFNPWSEADEGPNAGAAYADGHVDEDGFLCLGNEHGSHTLEESPYPLRFVLARAIYWCECFSYYKENGWFPQPRRGEA
ncbi:MAG: hypothetical protein ACOYOB_19530 [Myxococcota bacterium]